MAMMAARNATQQAAKLRTPPSGSPAQAPGVTPQAASISSTPIAELVTLHIRYMITVKGSFAFGKPAM